MPTISLIYARSECFDGDKEEHEKTEPTEAKVDAAKTPNEELQLPATGDATTAFLMSGTVLLALGYSILKIRK